EPHRGRARPAARADLQPSDRLADRAAGAPWAPSPGLGRGAAGAGGRHRMERMAAGARGARRRRRGARPMSVARRRIARAGYSLLLRLVLPLVLLRVRWRGRAEPLYATAIGERIGRYRDAVPPGALWVHAVSLG